MPTLTISSKTVDGFFRAARRLVKFLRKSLKLEVRGIKCNECVHNVGECKNEDSENYGKPTDKMGDCDDCETRRAYDYRTMTAWEFASKYYM